jgi:hypothetical protein
MVAMSRTRPAASHMLPVLLDGDEWQTSRSPLSFWLSGLLRWLRGQDSNLRPSGYEPDERATGLLHPACDNPKISNDGALAMHDVCRRHHEICLNVAQSTGLGVLGRQASAG